MDARKQLILGLIEARSREQIDELAVQFARYKGADREAILAALEFERWLADSCRQAAHLAEYGQL